MPENFAFWISFVVSFVIGFFVRRFWVVPILFVLGAAMGFGAALIYINFTLPTTKVGLGVIALLPAVLIISVSLHALSALVGGLIGTWLGKRKAKKKLPSIGSLRKN